MTPPVPAVRRHQSGAVRQERFSTRGTPGVGDAVDRRAEVASVWASLRLGSCSANAGGSRTSLRQSVAGRCSST